MLIHVLSIIILYVSFVDMSDNNSFSLGTRRYLCGEVCSRSLPAQPKMSHGPPC